jgi:hypothetical protein
MKRSTSFLGIDRFSPKGSIWRLGVSLSFLIFVIFRAGFRPVDGLQGYVDVAQGFPDSSSGFMRTSLVHAMLGWALNLDNRNLWMIAYLALTISALVTIRSWLASEGKNADQIMMLLLLGPIGTSLFIQIGHYDTLLIIGSLFLVVSRSVIIQFLAVLLMVGANVELAVVSLVMLAIVSSVMTTTVSPRRIVVLGLVSTLFWYSVSLRLFGTDAIEEGRVGFFVDQVKSSLILNTRTIPLLVFSFFGICWIPLVIVLRLQERTKTRALLAVGLIVVPALFTLLTLDGTRVFASLSAASFATVLIASSSQMMERFPSLYKPASIFVGSLVVPSVWSFIGDIRAPHGFLYELIFDR